MQFGLGLPGLRIGGYSGVAYVAEPIPEPVVVFQPSAGLAGSDNNPNLGFRVAATLTGAIDKGFRVTLRSGAGALELNNVGFGKRSSGAIATAPLIPLTFNDGETSVVLGPNTSITSDYVYVTDVTFAVDDVMLVGFAVGLGSTGLSSGNSNVVSYFGAPNNSMLADPSYATSAGNCFALQSIEARDYLPPAIVGIPLTADAAQFTGNASSLGENPADNATVLNKTINSLASGDASIFIAGFATVENCSVFSRECIRIAGDGATIRNSYLEATGQDEDHADTIQCFATTPVPAVVQVENTAIVAHETAATAGFFWADGFMGDVSFSNVMFMGGPYGLRIAADTDTVAHVSLVNVFFVYPFGAAPVFFEQIGDSDVIIDAWVNVRRAYLIGGQLIPGASIPQPVI